MSGRVLRHTKPSGHRCATPIRFWWRRLGIGARWQCDDCLQIWEVERHFQFQAKAGNNVYRTDWYATGETGVPTGWAWPVPPPVVMIADGEAADYDG